MTLARPRGTEDSGLLRTSKGKGLETEASSESLRRVRLPSESPTLCSQVTYPPHPARHREGVLQINERLWTQRQQTQQRAMLKYYTENRELS